VGFLSTSDQLVAEAADYTTHNKHKRRKSMPSAGFEPSMSAIEPRQCFALELLLWTSGCLIMVKESSSFLWFEDLTEVIVNFIGFYDIPCTLLDQCQRLLYS